MPQYLNDVSKRDLSVELFGQKYAFPYGVSPTGPAGLFRPGADVLLAQAAKAAGTPFVLSGASGNSIEEISAIYPEGVWFQLYTARDRNISYDQVKRAAAVGVDVLVVTVDTPLTPKRERHLRNGISVPFKLGARTLPRLAYEVARHPEWFLRFTLGGGVPPMANWLPYMLATATPTESMAFFFDQAFNPGGAGTISWRDIEQYRDRWKGKLVLKGIMHPDDAERAVALGCDGIIVSNHGGKSFDAAPSALRALPAIKQAVGNRMNVMFDSGIRRGTDIAKALCLGADFVFAGRPTLYGVAADGQQGAERVIDILRQEFDLAIAMMGCTSTYGLSHSPG